jgi:hypothetical protein
MVLETISGAPSKQWVKTKKSQRREQCQVESWSSPQEIEPLTVGPSVTQAPVSVWRAYAHVATK